MINRKEHPIGWSFFLDELEDAHEHLGTLIKELSESSDYTEAELRVDLGHVYAHLNRAWFRRNVPEHMSDAQWNTASQFPGDLEPVA